MNRLSWLRPSQSFLNAVIVAPNTRWILFNAGQPLMASSDDRSTKPSPMYLTTNNVKPFLGPVPYFGQGKEPGDLVHEKDHEEDTHKHYSPTESARHRGNPVIFLGVHEPQSSGSSAALPTSEFSDPEDAINKLDGTPYFAMDVADMDYTPERLQEILKETTLGQEGKALDWFEPRASMLNLDIFTAAVFASARSLVDWNLRNKVRHVVHLQISKSSFFTSISSIVPAVEHVHIPCGVDGRSVVHPYYLGPITATGNLAQPRRFCFCWSIQWLTFWTLVKGYRTSLTPAPML